MEDIWADPRLHPGRPRPDDATGPLEFTDSASATCTSTWSGSSKVSRARPGEVWIGEALVDR